MPLDDALRYAAERNGVQQDFWDIFGHRHFTEPETNRAILTALGLDCASEETLFRSLAAQTGAAFLLISHSPAVLGALAGTVLKIERGQVSRAA